MEEILPSLQKGEYNFIDEEISLINKDDEEISIINENNEKIPLINEDDEKIHEKSEKKAIKNDVVRKISTDENILTSEVIRENFPFAEYKNIKSEKNNVNIPKFDKKFEKINNDNIKSKVKEDTKEAEKNHEQDENKDFDNQSKQKQLTLSGKELLDYLNEEINSISKVDELKKLLPEILKIENEEVHKDSKALLYRKIGELYLEYEFKPEALKYFEKALDYNLKVGVKRLHTKLQKELE
jgi:hypothetical protein